MKILVGEGGFVFFVSRLLAGYRKVWEALEENLQALQEKIKVDDEKWIEETEFYGRLEVCLQEHTVAHDDRIWRFAGICRAPRVFLGSGRSSFANVTVLGVGERLERPLPQRKR
ncbi:MAG: hypothetical protein IV106_12100 [Pseudomonas umsongensis]|nr:hypothetical protein [Pseudomonas umsongensis]